AASTVENPESLPAVQRAAYFADRLQDERDGIGLEKTQKSMLVTLGRDALPALLAHLRDRRLTRVTASRRSYSTGYGGDPSTVLRVQDLALSAFERLTTMQSLSPGRTAPSTPFSAQAPEVREKIVAAVEGWWTTNADKTALQWRLARLSSLPPRERIVELAELERLD